MEKDEQVHRGFLMRDVVIGMSDGLTIPYALVAGLTAVSQTNEIIITAGIAIISAGALAMGLSGYFSVRSEYKEYQEELIRQGSKKNPTIEDSKEFFARLGLSDELQEQASEEMARDKDKWMAFVSGYSPVLPASSKKIITRSGFNIGLSYVAGGLLPLLPYFFTNDPHLALLYASVITLVCLFILGWLKGRITGRNSLGSAFMLTLIGAAAAGAAYLVARIFEGA